MEVRIGFPLASPDGHHPVQGFARISARGALNRFTVLQENQEFFCGPLARISWAETVASSRYWQHSSASHQVSSVVAERKSSISMASRGLWLPFWLRTNSMAMGTPQAANAAASCEAGLPS